ncbi:flagellar filament capping protein FliD [Clostridium sp. MB40-C1]|uniref:flagellar filament capping protein FliD n=1 Tax=Clostridium sp. MB40-C1 TaxID=3070996 RepID=UPI0027E0D285|nr:flagellar filament capping protein FliD [Clostridium sp. MB40-C1]WMJ81308.1 flagellar filament capping protein FliD [Clostridium sp. MB40-C1]
MTSISSPTSRMRMPGLATGTDTDAMVKAMTANYQVKIDKIGQDKQIMEWKQEFYREIIKDIKGLQNYFDPISDKYIMSSSKFNPMKVTNNDEGSLGIKTDSTAQEGTYKINVTQLAKPAVISGEVLEKPNGSAVTLDTKLSDLDPTVSGDVEFTINGKTVKIAVATDTTIKSVIDTINSNKDLDGTVKASFDELSKKIVFSTTATGSDAQLSVTCSNPGFGDFGSAGTVAGKNADFTLTYPDGRSEHITDQKSNKFTANGITYDLKAANTGDITFKIEKNNSDEIVKNIKGFIDDYNKIVEKIEGKLSEKKQFKIKPLTDEQKKDMKENDIKKWDEKAKQGILRNDDFLERLMGDLRGSFFEPVYGDKATGEKNSFCMGKYGTGALGLDTHKEFSERGKLFIDDEEKLKKAITDNIEDFTNFFIGKSSTKSDPNKYIGTDTYYEDGLFTRMDKIIREYAGDPGIGKDGISTVKGTLNIFANKQYDFSITGMSSKNTIPDQIYRKTLNITKLEKKMYEAQERYYTRFAQLEVAMNKMNNQMTSMASQFGIGG